MIQLFLSRSGFESNTVACNKCSLFITLRAFKLKKRRRVFYLENSSPLTLAYHPEPNVFRTFIAVTVTWYRDEGRSPPAEMSWYSLLISASYPYPLKTISIRILSDQTLLTAIRILSVSMVLLWYNYTASPKNPPDIFDCSFNIGCQILIVFGTGIRYPISQHQTMAFHFPPHITHSSALPGKQTYKNRMPVARGRRVRSNPPQPEPIDRPWWQ